MKEEILKLLPVETGRCFIRQPTLGDVDGIHHAMMQREEDLRRWMSWSSDEGMSREGVQAFISCGLEVMNTTGIPLIAIDKMTNKFVLASGIHGQDDEFLVTPTGWWIAKDFEGQGYAFEVMKAIIDLSFRMIGTKTITTEYYADNLRSKSLMERLGFKYVRTHEKFHQCHLDGNMMDVHEYILEKEK